MKIFHLYGVEHFQMNGVSPVLLLLDLDLHFQGQNFWILFFMWISHKWWEIEQTLLSPSDRKVLSSNGAILHVRHCDLDLYFQGHNISGIIYIISPKRWDLAKMLKYDFYRGWHLPSNGAILHVPHCDLDLYFQGHKISGNHKIYNIWKMMRTR